jgi:hypothetical protein
LRTAFPSRSRCANRAMSSLLLSTPLALAIPAAERANLDLPNFLARGSEGVEHRHPGRGWHRLYTLRHVDFTLLCMYIYIDFTLFGRSTLHSSAATLHSSADRLYTLRRQGTPCPRRAASPSRLRSTGSDDSKPEPKPMPKPKPCPSRDRKRHRRRA